MPVNEVVLTFHAADAQGLPITDLKLDEVRLLDDGRPPRQILDFQSLGNRPIRAGIVMDASESMAQTRAGNQAIAARYIQRMLHQQTDQVFVMDFAALSQVAQPWTNSPAALTAGLHKFVNVGSHTRGTALFDTIYRACLNQFGHIDHDASSNFILLFTDGEDNVSSVALKDAAAECEHTNTAIYAFRSDTKTSFGSAGPETLAQLAAVTGGRVLHSTGSAPDIDQDLRSIEADLRTRYRLVYRPAQMKRDGAFHPISLRTAERVASIVVRTGYYAPLH